MKINRYKHTRAFTKLMLSMIILLIFTSCSNKDAGDQSFDINVKINYKITLDDKVKGINPNIIKATRQAIFDNDSSKAKFFHYNGYSISNDVYIFEVNETDSNTWQVKFWEKPHNTGSYDKNSYSSVTVEKQTSGSFKGYIVDPGVPAIKGDETY